MDCTRLLASLTQSDARPIGDQEIVGFMEKNSELFSVAILSHDDSHPLIQKGQLSVSGKRMCTSTG